MEFYLRDTRSNTGSNVSFWNKNGSGYGTNLDNLEIYSLEDAQRQHDRRNSDVPLLKSLVDSMSITAVDCQVTPAANTTDPNGEYIVQIKGCWNGNDIKFISPNGNSYNYSKASILTYEEINKFFTDEGHYSVFSKFELDKVSRQTFQVGNICNAMTKGAGIKVVKPKRARKTTGKTRHNCPSCAKFVWDYNPYDAPYCSRFCEP